MAATMRSLAEGTVGGTAGAVVMSGWFRVSRRAGFMRERPPQRIVRTVVLPGSKERPRTAERPLGELAHLGFGASTGALFGLLTGRARPRVRTGVLYALAVWAVSYQGWIPAVGIMPFAHRDRPGRAVTMLTAHVPYGVVLALVLRRLRRSVDRKTGEAGGDTW
jgi:hypothetical protein